MAGWLLDGRTFKAEIHLHGVINLTEELGTIGGGNVQINADDNDSI